MKFYKYIFLFSLLIACNRYKDDYFGERISKDSYRPTEITDEDLLDSSQVKYSYYYEKKNDFYPTEIVVSSSEDSLIVRYILKLNDFRLPESMTKSINDSLIEYFELSYNPQNYFLTVKRTYSIVRGSRILIESNSYNFDENDVLISVRNEKFSSDSTYYNTDSTRHVSDEQFRILPSPSNRFKGNHNCLLFPDTLAKFLTLQDFQKNKRQYKKLRLRQGSKVYSFQTSWDSDGYPAYSNEIDNSKTYTRWYRTDKDGLGNVLSVFSYSDENFKKRNSDDYALGFVYDDRTYIYSISKSYYNHRTSKYDRLFSNETFNWLDFGLNNPQNFILMSHYGVSRQYIDSLDTYKFIHTEFPIFEKDVILKTVYEYASKNELKANEYKKRKLVKRVMIKLEKIRLKHKL